MWWLWLSVYTEISLNPHLSLNLPFRVKERSLWNRRRKYKPQSFQTLKSWLFPRQHTVIMLFMSFYLDAVWRCCCTSDTGRLWLRKDLYKSKDTRLCRTKTAQWNHQINMLLCSEGQSEQVNESDRVKGQCSSASLPDLSDRSSFLWSWLIPAAVCKLSQAFHCQCHVNINQKSTE